ncbi:MAG: trypsin-like peptidase domain-containing protein [Proteobacteria bacterium]|nr:trypsin-like peptidase domain-containing protein [Pseudomonadota bacterium]
MDPRAARPFGLAFARTMVVAAMAIAAPAAFVPADASDMATVPARSICRAAISGARNPAIWEQNKAYVDWVVEAQRRGYTPAFCAAVMDGVVASPPPPAAATAPAPAVAAAPQPDPLVVSIQTLLGRLGYDVGGADGVVGPRTQAAIAAFQERLGEHPNGRPSEVLRQRLQAAVAERGNHPPPATAAKGGRLWNGTGFFIGADIVITNHHVADGCSEIRLRKHGVDTGTAKPIATNRSDDLAALKADAPSDHHLKLRVGVPVKPAELVLVFGYPLSSVLSSLGNTTLGNVTALTGLQDDSRYIQISASVQAGNSGGPVLDENGRLVGVIEGKLDAIRVARATGDIPQKVNFAIRSTTLANFLEINQIAYEIAADTKPLSATELAQVAEAASMQLQCRR